MVAFSSILLTVFLWLRLSSATRAPVVGILGLPCSVSLHNCQFRDSAVSYIPASYVKWLEGGGGRVVPIPLGTSKREIESLIDNLNGVLFTGGAAFFEPGTLYWDTVTWITQYLRQTAQRSALKKAVPLWGTCLGFEAMVCVTSKTGAQCRDYGFDAHDFATTISFTPEAIKSSAIFGLESPMDDSYAANVMNAFATKNVSFNAHKYGIFTKTLSSDSYLAGNFTLVGTSVDRNGSEFVTLIQSKTGLKLFWYGAQFHAEKSQYVLDATGNLQLPHSVEAVFANQYLAEFFVNECRLRNDHVMGADMYWDKVIYNYAPVFSAKEDAHSSYEQIYVFD